MFINQKMHLSLQNKKLAPAYYVALEFSASLNNYCNCYRATLIFLDGFNIYNIINYKVNQIKSDFIFSFILAHDLLKIQTQYPIKTDKLGSNKDGGHALKRQ